MPENESTLWLAINSQRAKIGAGQFQAAAGKASIAAAGTTKSVDRLNVRMRSLGATAKSVAGPLIGFIGIMAGIRVIGTSVRLMADFEQTMLTVKGTVGATDEQMKMMTETARALGATTRYSAKEAGDALLFLARAGFTAEQAMIALPGTLDLATAGSLELGQAADFASNILAQFKLPVEEMSRVGDVLVNSASAANTSVLQMAEAMKYVGTVSGAAGISIEETAAAIGVLGDRGIQGSMAGTNLRQTMLRLLAPTSKAKARFKELGVTLEEMDPTSNTLISIFERLNEVGFDLADSTAIFSARTAAAAITMVDSTEKMRELTTANENAEGRAKDLAEMMDSGLKGAMLALKSATEELMLSWGDAGLGGVTKKLLTHLTNAIRLLAGVQDEMAASDTTARALATTFKIITATVAVLVSLKLVSWLISGSVAMIQLGTATAFANKSLALTGAIITGLIAFDVGGWLHDQFRFVDKFGSDVVAAISQVKSEVLFIWDFLSIHIRSGLETLMTWMINQIKSFITDPVVTNFLTGLSALVPGGGPALATTMAFARAPTVVKTDVDAELARIKAEKDERQLNIARGLLEGDRLRLEKFGKPGAKTTGRPLEGSQSYLDQLGASLGIETADEISAKMKQISADLEGMGGVPDTSGVANFQDELNKLNGSLDETASSLDDAQLSALGFFRELQIEKELIGLTTDERERSIKARELESLLIDMTIPQIDQLIKTLGMEADAEDSLADKIEKVTEAYKARLEEVQDTREIEASARKIGEAFGLAFEDATIGAKNFEDTMEDLATSVQRSLYKAFVTQPLTEGATGLARGLLSAFAGGWGASPNALGGAYYGGQKVTAFGKGGVVNQPTFFGYGNNQVGVAGEAGGEAILKLKRNSKGELGVISDNTRSVVVTMNFYGLSDVDSFKQSESQIVGNLVRRIRRG